MGRQSWYKFFGQRECAEKFLKGEVLFRSLAYFRTSKTRQINRSSETETKVRGQRCLKVASLRPIRSRESLSVNWLSPSSSTHWNTQEIFVFCVSNSFADLLKQEFGAEACIEISNKRKFFVRLESALP